jgi:hypothetical protein
VERPPTDEILHWFMPTGALHQITKLCELLRRCHAIGIDVNLEAFTSEHMCDQQV